LNTSIILLGANLGDREATFKNAFGLIEEHVGNITNFSSMYETAAWGVTDQPDFLNQIIIVQTKLSPQKLIHVLQDIELSLGRKLREKWHARTIDIDILFYNEAIIEEDNLQIPHPAIASRRFTLVPLAEVVPELIHPVHQISIRQLLHLCVDTLPVRRVTKDERHSA